MSEDGHRGPPPSWEPTPEEIAAECELIRASWSPAERRRRCAWAITGRVTVTEVHADEREGLLGLTPASVVRH
ncbi:hypothetical protein [Lacipirellula limnantheis]|uniref:Uncharacterized protein n=1 Tax=Lacipirellula limnantheis TaxID=2528024 RepID=A0A517U532_9BACT|nr:hypothetical protein [Lacipirellula limnantheis]QDT75758.1 hypothetical protein I41_50000 [Lacipirellula limnantheis]